MRNDKKGFKYDIKELLLDTAADIAGGLIYAVGLYMFAKNAGFAPGGVSGISVIINHMTELPIGVVNFVLNIPLVILGYRVMGRKFLFKSVKTLLFCTLFLDVVMPLFPPYTGQPILASIFTGLCVGIGCSIVYLRGSSTGGIDFLIMSLRKKFPHLSIGQIMMALDFMIVAAGGFAYGSIDAALYGFIATIVNTVVLDRIMLGFTTGKLLMIITGEGQGRALAGEIDQIVGRGATIIKAQGSYSGAPKDMIICACSNIQISRIKAVAYNFDKKSLVVVLQTNQVLGEGFDVPENI